MAETIIKRIYTNTSFYKKNESAGFKALTDSLMVKYGPLVRQAVQLTNVPLAVFQSLLMVENANSNPQATSSANAYGLGQLQPGAALDVIWRENKLGRLSDAEKAILRKRMGSKLELITVDAAPNLTGIQKMTQGGFWYNAKTAKSTQIKDLVTPQDLFDPEFNLLVSAMALSQLIDEEIQVTPQGNLVRLDKVIVRYNRGYNTKFTPFIGTEDLVATANQESSDYIKKMVGVHGILSVLSA